MIFTFRSVVLPFLLSLKKKGRVYLPVSLVFCGTGCDTQSSVEVSEVPTAFLKSNPFVLDETVIRYIVAVVSAPPERVILFFGSNKG